MSHNKEHKITMYDLIECNDQIYPEKKLQNKKIYDDKNKIQDNYGHKKFIKPWRTGVKSQQQPPTKGFKGGGRRGKR